MKNIKKNIAVRGAQINKKLSRSLGLDKNKTVENLNTILGLELAGVVKYTHYAFMVQGPYRLAVVDWLRGQAQESLAHAQLVGEHITSLG